jgi:hypothetical protein
MPQNNTPDESKGVWIGTLSPSDRDYLVAAIQAFRPAVPTMPRDPGDNATAAQALKYGREAVAFVAASQHYNEVHGDSIALESRLVAAIPRTRKSKDEDEEADEATEAEA